MADTLFYDEFPDNFYSTVGESFKSSFERGQLYWSHIQYTQEHYEFWRPKNYDPTQAIANEFQIVSSTQDPFRRKLPLTTPKLEINEEFVVVRAKRRPVMLISPAPPEIRTQRIRGGGKVNSNLCLVAPLYSLSNDDGGAKYDLTFVDQVRKLEYPHMFFLPSSGSDLPKNSLCKLDSIQAIHCNRLEAINLRLGDEALDVFQGMLKHHTTSEYDGDFKEYREVLLSGS